MSCKERERAVGEEHRTERGCEARGKEMASSEAAGGGDGAKLRLYQRASKPRSEKTDSAGRWMWRTGTKARKRKEERRSLGTFRNRATSGKERTSFEGK